MHMPACLTHTKHTHAGCHPHSHTAFQTSWIGPRTIHSTFTALHACTHTPLPPPTLARTPELELLQSPLVAGPQHPLQRCVFSAEPHSLYRILWELVSDAAAQAHYLFISSSSRPDPPVRRAAAQTETGRKLPGHRRQRTEGRPLRSPTWYIKLTKSPSGHEHHAGKQKRGGRLQQEGTGGRASGPSPPEPAAPAQTGHPVPAQGLR